MKSHQDRANTLIRQANDAKENGRIDDAIRAYKEAIELVPAYRSFDLVIAEMLLENNRHDEAVTAYEEMLVKHPENEQAWLGLGKCKLLMDNHDGAMNSFQSAMAANENSAEANYYVALLLSLRGEIKEVEPLLFKALKLQPSWEAQARLEASLKPVFENSRRLKNIGRAKKWWEVWK